MLGILAALVGLAIGLIRAVVSMGLFALGGIIVLLIGAGVAWGLYTWVNG